MGDDLPVARPTACQPAQGWSLEEEYRDFFITTVQVLEEEERPQAWRPDSEAPPLPLSPLSLLLTSSFYLTPP